MNDTKDTTIPVLEHGDKMDAHAVDGQGSSTQMAGAAQLHQSSQLCQSCTSSAVWRAQSFTTRFQGCNSNI